MSKKHVDRIVAFQGVLQTDTGRSTALCFLLGSLSSVAQEGKPLSVTRLTEIVESAVEYAREYEAKWRSPAETELPEPREMAPLVDVPTVDERKPAEIVAGKDLYGDAELDGLACILCHEEFAVGEASVPAGIVDGGPQVFAHGLCLGILHAPMPGYATRMTRCGVPLSRGSGVGPRTALNLADVTCIACQKVLAAEWTPKAGGLLDEDQPVSPARGHGQEELPEPSVASEAAGVIDEWTPKASAALLPQPRTLWVHSGPCIYCAHGPGCVTCDLTQGPHWGIEPHPGPVCTYCSDECKRREIAADPYYSGDYVTMFGDDE